MDAWTLAQQLNSLWSVAVGDISKFEPHVNRLLTKSKLDRSDVFRHLRRIAPDTGPLIEEACLTCLRSQERSSQVAKANLIEQEELLQRRSKDAEKDYLNRKRALLDRICVAFDADFLTADEIFANDPDASLITEAELLDLKATFVRTWAHTHLLPEIDGQQANAIAEHAGDVLVTARAGSGKTRTLVTRTIFLCQHCRVSPNSILVLAFNTKAASEILDRLSEHLAAPLPHVMTFHALAHAIVQPEEDVIRDDPRSDHHGLSREVQAVIDDHIKSDAYAKQIRDLMLASFAEDWERIVNGEFQGSIEEFNKHRRALPRESLHGEYVKSFGEKLIANTLFENGVDYKYERNFHWNAVNYRPDFAIPLGNKGGVIVEYFGRLGDADYDRRAQEKRVFWQSHPEWRFIEYTPSQILMRGASRFATQLTEDLQAVGVKCSKRSEEDIWQQIQRRAIDKFTKAMTSFVGRCRKANLSAIDVRQLVSTHRSCLLSEAHFIEIGASVYSSYLERLATNRLDDHDGIMSRAIVMLNAGQSSFVRAAGRETGDTRSLRWLMVDEFQDFSKQFAELVDSIRLLIRTLAFMALVMTGKPSTLLRGPTLSSLRTSQHTSAVREGAIYSPTTARRRAW